MHRARWACVQRTAPRRVPAGIPFRGQERCFCLHLGPPSGVTKVHWLGLKKACDEMELLPVELKLAAKTGGCLSPAFPGT